VEGNPVNAVDPSGHSSCGRYIGDCNVCSNPYRPDGTFDYETFEKCRLRVALFGTTYVKRSGDPATFLHLDINNVCRNTGPSSGTDACAYFQKRRNVVAIVIHHTGGPIASLDNLLPTYLTNSNYDQIDYPFHFLVDKAGFVFEARPMLVRGSHASGGNLGSIGVEIEGDFTKSLPVKTQINATIALIHAIRRERVKLLYLQSC